MINEPTTDGINGFDDRAPETRHFGPLFGLGDDPVTAMVALTASRAIEDLPDGSELTAGLRKLLEARDCFDRAARLAGR